MQLTNKNKLPHPIMEALKYDTYKVGGDISVTTLIDAPQIRILKMRHKDEIVQDASDMLWALMGTAVHHILERAHIKDHRREAFFTVIAFLKDECKKIESADMVNDKAVAGITQLMDTLKKCIIKFFPEVKDRYIWEHTLSFEYGGRILYGTFDLYDQIDCILFDYKVCGVYVYSNEEAQKKWNAQTNTYAFMLRLEGREVKEIKIVAMFRDWSSAKAEFAARDYPKTQVCVIDIPVVPQDKMQVWVEGRMDLHIGAEKGVVPECTDKERWATANTFAIKKHGMKKAIKLFSAQQEGTAKEYVRVNNPKHDSKLYMETRIGEARRCEAYCVVRDFCEQKKRNDEEFRRINNS